jgi:two-component system response regulator HydG
VVVNCGAIPEALFESELFGHTRGAFTDAKFDRQGLMAAAYGGTLFLDELGDLPLAMQVKLLRALEERRIRPVGSSQEIAIDVRLVAATHRDLEEAIEAGKFREDLFYRVNVIQLELPPLRARGRDILLIAQFLLTKLSQRQGKTIQGIAAPAAEKLLNYSWPGNVRELRNVMERAVALAAHDQILVDDLPPKVREHSAKNLVLSGSQPDELVPLEQIERQYIRHVLDACHGNKTMAAKILGLDRKTLYRKLGEAPGGN